MEMDIAPAYGLENLNSLRRRVSFEKETGKVTITDSFDLTAPAELTERFVSYSVPAAEDGKVVLTGPNSTTVLTYDAAVFTVSFAEEYPLKGRKESTASKPVYVIDFKAKNPEAKCTFTFTAE